MGIIDVIVEKPAFKRTMGGDEAERESAPEEAKASGGRPVLKTVGAVVVGLVGMLTFRKLRNRRKSGG